jgi:hypothetical protein
MTYRGVSLRTSLTLGYYEIFTFSPLQNTSNLMIIDVSHQSLTPPIKILTTLLQIGIESL